MKVSMQIKNLSLSSLLGLVLAKRTLSGMGMIIELNPRRGDMQILDQDGIKALAQLPSLDELRGGLVGLRLGQRHARRATTRTPPVAGGGMAGPVRR